MWGRLLYEVVVKVNTRPVDRGSLGSVGSGDGWDPKTGAVTEDTVVPVHLREGGGSGPSVLLRDKSDRGTWGVPVAKVSGPLGSGETHRLRRIAKTETSGETTPTPGDPGPRRSWVRVDSGGGLEEGGSPTRPETGDGTVTRPTRETRVKRTTSGPQPKSHGNTKEEVPDPCISV